jgi:cytochrome c oxidase assembly protein subunit 15
MNRVITRFAVTPALVRRLALASLVANVGIVLTGGAVRLTGSGLGCPTWPRCSDESWTATPEMGIHGLIEYGNRTLTGVLGVLALAGLLAAVALRPRRRSLVWLATAVLAGIAVQGLLGGLTVWTDLNPWIVGGHFLVSIALIATAYTFWRRVDEPDAPVRASVPAPLRTLARLVAATSATLLTVGTVVTGSGPHAGDERVPRNGLDPQAVSQLHADLGFLLLGLAVAGALALRAVGAERRATRAAAVLVVVILAQGALGLVQYATGLPELLVWLHLLGSCLVWLAALALLHGTRQRLAEVPAAPRPAAPRPAAARRARARERTNALSARPE